MKRWPRITVRIFGVLHIVMGLVGIIMIAWGCVSPMTQLLLESPRYPYAKPFYYGYTIIGLISLVFLIGAGVAMCRLAPRGRQLSNVVLGFEIAFSLAEWETILFVLPMWGATAKKLGDTLLMTSGIGAFDEVQILTGYPLIALIAINLAYKRLHEKAMVPGPIRENAETGWKPWPRAVLRTFGLLDLVVAVWGLNVVAVWYALVIESRTGLDATRPNMLPIFRIETIVAVGCFVLLIPTGVALWRLDRLGARMSRAIFGLALAVFLADLGARLVVFRGARGAMAVGETLESSVGALVFLVPLLLYLVVVVGAISVASRRMPAGSGWRTTKLCAP